MRGLGRSDMTEQSSSHRLYVPQAPTTYTLELTSYCNNACVGCGNVFSRGLGEMPVERWVSLLDRLHPYLDNIRVTGGEPTLHRQFSPIIRAIDRLEVPFVLFSNGVWESRQEMFSLLLGCSNLDGVLISLHGQNNSSHRQFVGHDSFEETVVSIREATQAGLSVNTNTVLNRANYRDVEEIAYFALGLGAGSVAFSRYYGAPTPVTALNDDELLYAIKSVHTLKARNVPVRFNNNVPACFTGYASKSCPAGITHCTIDPLGNVRPCNHAPVIFGSLFEHSIEVLWHSEQACWWRDLIPDACYRCAEFDSCRGGCKATALQLGQGQDPLMRSPLVKGLRQDIPRKVTLYEQAVPIRNFRIHEEKFGFWLVNRSRTLAVGPDFRQLLGLLDGVHSLRMIQHLCGQDALNLVGRLYVEGLVHFANNGPAVADRTDGVHETSTVRR